jgi:hypothetical protein
MQIDRTTRNTLQIGRTRVEQAAGGKVGRSRHRDASVTLRRGRLKKPVTKLGTINPLGMAAL